MTGPKIIVTLDLGPRCVARLSEEALWNHLSKPGVLYLLYTPHPTELQQSALNS